MKCSLGKVTCPWLHSWSRGTAGIQTEGHLISKSALSTLPQISYIIINFLYFIYLCMRGWEQEASFQHVEKCNFTVLWSGGGMWRDLPGCSIYSLSQNSKKWLDHISAWAIVSSPEKELLFLESREVSQKVWGGRTLLFIIVHLYSTYTIQNSFVIVMYVHLVKENVSGLNNVLFNWKQRVSSNLC